MKWCWNCKTEKPQSEFDKDRSRPDGISARCKECRRLSVRQHYRRHVDEYKQRATEWAKNNLTKRREIVSRSDAKHKEERTEYRKQWYQDNKPKKRESLRAWRKENPERGMSYNQMRHARHSDTPGSFTAEEWNALCEKYERRCLCCGRTGVKLTADHVIPIGMPGSTNFIDGIQPLCGSCNSKKRRRTTDYRLHVNSPLKTLSEIANGETPNAYQAGESRAEIETERQGRASACNSPSHKEMNLWSKAEMTLPSN